ncbi:MAG: hypothetical protein MZV63_57420 [Marinilabiliales bacterium]|nr:hypothetical protein [Marinilabiliales bacterium]
MTNNLNPEYDLTANSKINKMKREFKTTFLGFAALMILMLHCQDIYSQPDGLTLENALNMAYSNSPDNSKDYSEPNKK